MKINLTELLRKPGNEGEIEAEEPVSFPEDGLVLTRPVKATLHLTNTGSSVLLSGEVATEVELDCSRCLEKFRTPIKVNLAEEFVKNQPAAAGKSRQEIELKEKDFVYPIEPDNTLDLSEIIRQNLALAVPISPLCEKKCSSFEVRRTK